MEVFFPCNTSTCLNLSHNAGSSLDPHNLSRCNARDLNIDELKTCLAEIYEIQDSCSSMSGFCLSPKRKTPSNTERDECINSDDESEMSSSVSNKLFSKYTAFTPFGEPKIWAGELTDGSARQDSDLTAEISDGNNPLVSTGWKLVSAMKGSREKQGMAPKKKLSVTWAADVYDPVPTSVSHALSDRNQHYRNGGKKYCKNKQKGGSKSGRGSNGKGKIHARKNNGNVSKLKSF